MLWFYLIIMTNTGFYSERRNGTVKEATRHAQTELVQTDLRVSSQNLTNYLTHGAGAIHPPPPDPLTWFKISITLIFHCSLTVIPTVCSLLSVLLSKQQGDFKGSCHLTWCWMGRPPGAFVWQEERTSTSPWPSPGWVSEWHNVCIIRTEAKWYQVASFLSSSLNNFFSFPSAFFK